MHPLRTRFKKEIVAEFLPPARYDRKKAQKAVIIFDGMPSVPNRRPILKFFSEKGYWAVNPRYRGAWESDGLFLERSPEEDARDVIDGLYREIKDLTWGKRFRINPSRIFVVGGSFGGPAAILASLDPRVDKVIANCPVVDWTVLKRAERRETANPSYPAYVRAAFGNGYRLTDGNWKKLYSGKFYNPAHRAREIDPRKVMMFHAKDDPIVPWRSVAKFSKGTGAKLNLLARGGHLRTDYVIQKYWPRIKKFFDSK